VINAGFAGVNHPSIRRSRKTIHQPASKERTRETKSFDNKAQIKIDDAQIQEEICAFLQDPKLAAERERVLKSLGRKPRYCATDSHNNFNDMRNG
jgi:hypothetical protein